MNQSVREATLAPERRGTNQAGMRAFNERLVLTLVRAHGRLAKTDIARLTGLSAQTVSVIMRALEAEHLLRRGEPRRGRVGQPSVPLSLDPDGAYFIGVKIGRRSLDLVLVDFAGNIRHREVETYAYPTPGQAIETIREGVGACEKLLGARTGRIAGVGLAMPFLLWEWAEAVGAPPEELDLWRQLDLRAEVGRALPYPVYLQNDATAACGAELVFGRQGMLRDFIYFYIGAFIGGGLVIDGGLYAGRSGNAAAVGSMPVPRTGGGTEQLIHQASLVVLERRLRAAGHDTKPLYDPEADWSGFGEHLDAWLDQASRGIAAAVAVAGAVIDIEAAVIDGAMPPAIQTRLIEGVAAALGGMDLSGIQCPAVEPGSLGPAARALGGATLPLLDRYLVDQHRLASIRADPALA